MERRHSAHEVGGVSDAEIRRNSPAHSAICLDGLILPSWKPEFNAGQILADANDVAKMIHAFADRRSHATGSVGLSSDK